MKHIIILFFALCAFSGFSAPEPEVSKEQAKRFAREAREIRKVARGLKKSKKFSGMKKTKWDMVYPKPYTHLWHLKHKAKKLENEGKPTDALWEEYTGRKEKKDVEKHEKRKKEKKEHEERLKKFLEEKAKKEKEKKEKEKK